MVSQSVFNTIQESHRENNPDGGHTLRVVNDSFGREKIECDVPKCCASYSSDEYSPLAGSSSRYGMGSSNYSQVSGYSDKGYLESQLSNVGYENQAIGYRKAA